MPKMTHWRSPEPVDVPSEKAAVYAAQGWVSVDAKPVKVQPATAMTTDAAEESAPVKPVKKAAKKAAARKSVAKKAHAATKQSAPIKAPRRKSA